MATTWLRLALRVRPQRVEATAATVLVLGARQALLQAQAQLV